MNTVTHAFKLRSHLHLCQKEYSWCFPFSFFLIMMSLYLLLSTVYCCLDKPTYLQKRTHDSGKYCLSIFQVGLNMVVMSALSYVGGNKESI